jgi:hypothetical protein
VDPMVALRAHDRVLVVLKVLASGWHYVFECQSALAHSSSRRY